MIEGVQLSEQLLLDAAAATEGQGQVRKILREPCGGKESVLERNRDW